MRLKSLTAKRVHGYLDLNVEFKPELTFLVGLNGSGKTSALRLLMGLLTPSLEVFTELDFERTALVVEMESKVERTIVAEKTELGYSLSISGLEDALEICVGDLRDDLARRRRGESSGIISGMKAHAVVSEIEALSTPLFLGLDRRFQGQEWMPDESVARLRHRESLRRRFAIRGAIGPGLMDVQRIVQDEVTVMRTKQNHLDDELRQEVILNALTFVPSDPFAMEGELSRGQMEDFRTKVEGIENLVGVLGVPSDDVRERVDAFATEMENLAKRLAGGFGRGAKKSRARDDAGQALLTWMANKAQIDRILGLFEKVEEYVDRRGKLQSRLDNFIELVNGFFVQTHKSVVVSEKGRLEVGLATGDTRSLDALSSGERQIVVMLAHLALNRQLDTAGVFIVDEPELSLHISWQEKFVEAVRKASPSTQLILATHSPAIILNRDAHCVELPGGLRA